MYTNILKKSLVQKRVLILVLFLGFLSTSFADEQIKTISQTKKSIQQMLNKFCLDCHNDKKQKGEIQLNKFSDISTLAQFELLNKIEEQVYLEQMPPKDEDLLPTAAEKKILLDSIQRLHELRGNKSNFQDKLSKPAYGNYVDHEKLFSGEFKDLKGFTYDRHWLISEYIFDDKMNVLLGSPRVSIDGRRLSISSEKNKARGFPVPAGITNPFLLPTNTGVRYYANEELSGGHFLTMITNAHNAASQMVAKSRGDYLPAISDIMALERQHKSTLDRRKKFLTDFIVDVCEDIYKNKNQELLPAFVPVKLKSHSDKFKGTKVKKAPFHTVSRDRAEVGQVYLAIKRYKANGLSGDQLIEQCEKDWFYRGVAQNLIQSRLTYMKGYMPEILVYTHYKRAKAPKYKALSKAEMDLIADTIKKHRVKGDHYVDIINKCMAYWHGQLKEERIKAGPPSAVLLTSLINQVYLKLYERSPNQKELHEHLTLVRNYIEKLGSVNAVKKFIQSLMLRTEFVYRNEYGEGTTDQYGRQLLSPRNASYALSYALTDSSPDKYLREAVKNGKLNTREDYKREILRMLKDKSQYYIIDKVVEGKDFTSNVTNTPIRKLRFFREFFGYPNMLSIFKDQKRFGASLNSSSPRLVAEADLLVDHILMKDQNVFEELLTTEKFFTFHNGNEKKMAASTKQLQNIYNYFTKAGWKSWKTDEELLKHKDFFEKVGFPGVSIKTIGQKKKRGSSAIKTFQAVMKDIDRRFAKGHKTVAPHYNFRGQGERISMTRKGRQMRGQEVFKFFNIDIYDWEYTARQPAKVPNRKGMLTHPAWLMAHAQNTETDPVRRGLWVREKLLAGTVPDVPITVDAVIPEDHHRTLRMRLETKTQTKECWKCHKHMNPLGNTFEIFDDFGRYRTQEELEHPENVINGEQAKRADKQAAKTFRLRYKTLPVNAKGVLSGTGDKNLDGEVKDAFDMIDRIAKAKRVRQSIIRHAFRYFMGRNEVLSDSKTLIDADEAYVKNGGSFDAVILSLLTSDSFIYRKKVKE